MIFKTYAKINLTLDILSKRPDGYHELKTVMQSISLFDELDIEPANKIIISCSGKNIPTGPKNTCYKAAEKFFEYTKIRGGVKIHIDKKIPSEAGLGGGSADAAATIKALNVMYGGVLSVHEMLMIAGQVGADVPFGIIGGTALCQGIGEKIETLEGLPKKYIVLVKPDAGVSTAEAYSDFDRMAIKSQRGTEKFLEALKSREDPYKFLSNDFEQVVKGDWLIDIKKKLLGLGAEAALMSGSGSTVYGVFDDEAAAKNAGEKIGCYPYVCICRTI